MPAGHFVVTSNVDGAFAVHKNRDPLVAVASIEDRRLQTHSLGMAYLTPTDNEASDEPKVIARLVNRAVD